jgi:D-alanine-D-alanine ligase
MYASSDGANAPKRPPKRRHGSIDVAILYNVDFEGAIALGSADGADHALAARASVQSVADDLAEALSHEGAHTVALVPVDGDFADLRARLAALAPSCVFNLCESLGRDARLETAVPMVLDLMGIPYTGSPAEALSAALYKDRVKARLLAAGVPTPRATVLADPAAPCSIRLPAIVKPSREDGSAGITSESVVYDEISLRARAADCIASFGAPCLVEEYIEGREFNVALLGYPQARVLPLQEIDFSDMPGDRPPIVTYDAKWKVGSIDDIGTRPVVHVHPALPASVAARIRRAASEAFRAVDVRDYGRVDVRLSPSGVPYVIDVNPNCDLAAEGGFARAARAVGIDHPALARLLVRYALRRKKGVPSAGQPRAATSPAAR